MIESLLKSSAAMTIVIMTWLLVQTAYRRMFAGDSPARASLDGCWTCHGCGGADGGPGCQGVSTEPAAEFARDESRTKDGVFPG